MALGEVLGEAHGKVLPELKKLRGVGEHQNEYAVDNPSLYRLFREYYTRLVWLSQVVR